jgi:hypothetical protein
MTNVDIGDDGQAGGVIEKGAVPDNADMCYWIGDEEESIKQGEAG